MIKDKKILARMADEDLRTPSHDAIMIWLQENILQVLGEISSSIERHPDLGVVPTLNAEDITVKWESPVWGGGYLNSYGERVGSRSIIGYVDMLAECSRRVYFPDVAFEVKATIRSIGETIRQINTYRAHLKNIPFCIVSPDGRFRAILESQGILFVKAPAMGDSGAQGGLF